MKISVYEISPSPKKKCDNSTESCSMTGVTKMFPTVAALLS
jgi:hypothetical protein